MSRVGPHAARLSRLAATSLGESEATVANVSQCVAAGPQFAQTASRLPALSAASGPMPTSCGLTRSRASGQPALRPADARWISQTPLRCAMLPDPGPSVPSAAESARHLQGRKQPAASGGSGRWMLWLRQALGRRGSARPSSQGDQDGFLLAADGTRLMGGAGGRGYLRPPADAPDKAAESALPSPTAAAASDRATAAAAGRSGTPYRGRNGLLGLGPPASGASASVRHLTASRGRLPREESPGWAEAADTRRGGGPPPGVLGGRPALKMSAAAPRGSGDGGREGSPHPNGSSGGDGVSGAGSAQAAAPSGSNRDPPELKGKAGGGGSNTSRGANVGRRARSSELASSLANAAAGGRTAPGPIRVPPPRSQQQSPAKAASPTAPAAPLDVGATWRQIIASCRDDRERLKRTVERLHEHCLATGQHPPLPAYNALLGAVNEAGSVDHCHLMADILQRTGLQGNDETLRRLYEAYPYNDRIRMNTKPSD